MTTLLEEREEVEAVPKVSPPHAAEARGPILLVRLGAIGDVIRTLPALAWLRESFPGVDVDWLVEERSAGLLRGHPDLRQTIVFKRRDLAKQAWRLRLGSATSTLRGAIGRLRDGRYTAVVDFQGSLKSALLARASGCDVRIGLAPGHGREGSHRFYTRRVDPGPERISRVDRNFRLLEPLGCPAVTPPDDRPMGHLPLSDADRGWAGGVLASLAPADAPRVLLYPGTSQRQAYKRWPAGRYGFVAGRLRDEGVQVLVAGGPGEEEIVDKVRQATSSPPEAVPASTLTQLAALLAEVDLFVGGDTGPMHLAWSVGTRVLGLFGATDPVINAPYDPLGLGHRVIYHGPEDRPYRVKGARARQWMEEITVDEVHKACRQMLGVSNAGESCAE